MIKLLIELDLQELTPGHGHGHGHGQGHEIVEFPIVKELPEIKVLLLTLNMLVLNSIS